MVICLAPSNSHVGPPTNAQSLTANYPNPEAVLNSAPYFSSVLSDSDRLRYRASQNSFFFWLNYFIGPKFPLYHTALYNRDGLYYTVTSIGRALNVEYFPMHTQAFMAELHVAVSYASTQAIRPVQGLTRSELWNYIDSLSELTSASRSPESPPNTGCFCDSKVYLHSTYLPLSLVLY